MESTVAQDEKPETYSSVLTRPVHKFVGLRAYNTTD